MPQQIETQTPDGPLPLLSHGSPRSSPSFVPPRLPRPQSLTTTKTCCGCHIYRPRTTCAAMLMLTLGTLFLVLGLSSMFSESVDTGGRGVSLIILGGIMFLPGSYATYILLGIHLRWDNFDGTMLPSYDDDEIEDSSHM